MPETFRVLVTCDLGEAALGKFAEQPGFSVRVEDIKNEEQLVRSIPGYHAVVVRSNVRVTAQVLSAGRDLRVVGRAGIGVDNVDVAEATRRGVAVVNAPGGNVVTTAEHAVALLMSLARRVPQASATMKAGHWEKKRYVGRELRGKTLGIVGVGRVGSVVADLAQGLRLRVRAYDPYLSDEQAARLGVEKVGLDDLLEQADFITVHTPLTPETRGIIGVDAFAKVKPGVMVVNCARGGVVDEDALLEAIEAGHVGGAALDVFEQEPPPPHPLYRRDEVILTPHLGASTVEAQTGVALEVAENIITYLTTGMAANSVNAPSISPETLQRLGPYLVLAERLGLFLVQLAKGPVETVHVTCRGRATSDGTELIVSSLLQGLLSHALSSRINLVNAPAVARDRGLKIISSNTDEIRDLADLVAVRVEGAWGAVELEGTLFGRHEPRLVRFGDYHLDALLRGNLILIYNDDVPGVIGGVGNCLGARDVNIAGMYNGRDRAGGKAICLVNIDSAATEEALEDLRGLPHIQSAQQVLLDQDENVSL